MSVTADDFLVGVKQRITYPANDQLLNDAALLSMTDKVIRDKLVPLMLSVNQDFFVTTVSTPLVAGQAQYPIFYRAIGRGLRDLKLVNNGNTANTYSMRKIALEDEHLFQNQSVPTGFYFSGDFINLLPVPITADYTLKQFVNLQRGSLVQTSAAAKITSIAGNMVTCASLPTTFTSGVIIDFIQGKSGSSTLAWDITATSVSGNQLTFASASVLPSTLAVGDWVALAQQSPVIQLPDEASPLLETKVCERILYAIGDYDGSQKLREDGAVQEKDLLMILQPRIEGEREKIVNRNGLLRARGFNYWRVRGGYYY